ncbi:hypothetical protein FHX03_003837 [Rhizobium sp. BK456]|nr:hypothetical protein [Rhizobium sp. BK456]
MCTAGRKMARVCNTVDNVIRGCCETGAGYCGRRLCATEILNDRFGPAFSGVS